ncbi:MAG TPA: choice-of-anchor tandem repeat GloVer-containing protein [Rhizomicrobium sp.]
MRTSTFTLFTAAIACALSQQISPALSSERVIHSFGSTQTDGGFPLATLLNVNGKFYGTTGQGGANSQGGTVFSLDPKTGKEKVLYSFCSAPLCRDGTQPRAGLIEMSGLLYGTTSGGGANGGGVVFSVDPVFGLEKVVYSFCSQQNCTDGEQPFGGLFAAKGMFYGTTVAGGANGEGTVFALDPNTGQAQVLHAFGAGMDGASPRATLIGVRSKLYGTTDLGGANNGGTVFSLNPATGAETVLYSFCSRENCTDGSNPIGGLIRIGPELYGTTDNGGANNKGTVYALAPRDGVEKVLYSFCSRKKCADGDGPYVGLIKHRGLLFGTTEYGGTDGCHDYGCGTVFAVNPVTGAETPIYSFCSAHGCTDGASPAGGLIHDKGKLYGTTTAGGISTICKGGCGTVFEIQNP